MSKKLPTPLEQNLREFLSRPGASISKGATAFNTSRITFKRWLNEYKIEWKDHITISREVNELIKAKIPLKDELVELYVNQQKSIEFLRVKYHCKQASIYEWIKEYDIPLRTLAQSTKIGKSKQYSHIQFSKEIVFEIYDEVRNIGILADKLNVSYSHAKNLLHRYELEIYQPNSSVAEEEIFNFCKYAIPDGEWIKSDRNLIDPLELDIISYKHKLAIEYCGLYWHGENLSKRDRKYHKLKYDLCKEKGFSLITIFSSDNIEKIYGILLHKLGLSNERMFARKCLLKELKSSEARDFHTKYHINGYVGSSVNYGLYYNENLFQVISFSKSRFNKNFEWECTRSSIKFNCAIIGGVSKIFKHFIDEYNVKSLITYADLRFGEGMVYEKCNLQYIGTTTPNYWYFFPDKDKLYSRVQFQKHKLKEKLDNFDPELSEWDNMKNNGYDRIWDCGNNIYGFKI